MEPALPAGVRWRRGRGWLVLIGGTSDQWRTTAPIDRAAVALMDRTRPIAFVPAAACPPDYGESFLATYGRLGAPGGYIVPVHDRGSANEPTNADLLRRAGLIYFGGGETAELLRTMNGSRALKAVAEAYEAGAVIAGMSAGAIALAEWGVPLNPDIGVLRGWGWLPATVVSVHHTPEREVGLDSALAAHPHLLGIGLPEDVALALGPAGEERTLGESGIVVRPGAVFDASAPG
jgi:cyanophycinase